MVTIPDKLASEILQELFELGLAEGADPKRARRIYRLWRDLRKAMGE